MHAFIGPREDVLRDAETMEIASGQREEDLKPVSGR
jgi:hypothetical protein